MAPYLVFTVSDEAGNVVRKLTKAAAKGIQRIAWDLTYAGTSPVQVRDKFNPTNQTSGGTLVMPGKYKVAMQLVWRDGIKDLVKAVDFNVTVLKNTSLRKPPNNLR